MNATITTQTVMPHASQRPPLAHGTPGSAAQMQTPPRRLSVWDERARKMGFPPSSRQASFDTTCAAGRDTARWDQLIKAAGIEPE